MPITNLDLDNKINNLHNEFVQLVEILNHRVTKLEEHVWWLKWILGYVAIIMTGMFIKVLVGG
jgi:hypothetical protein